MSEARIGQCASGITSDAGASGVGTWLSLAAAPTFAVMAIATGVLDRSASDALCASAAPVSGMVPMYVLMSLFHVAPWLRLVSGRRDPARAC